MVFTGQDNWWVGVCCGHFRFTHRVLRQAVNRFVFRLSWFIIKILARNVSPVNLPVFPHIVWIFHFPSYLEQVGHLLIPLPVHLQLDVPQDIGVVWLCLTGRVPGILPQNLHQSVLFISRDELLVDVAGQFDCVIRGLLQNILDTILSEVDTRGQLQQVSGVHSRPGPHVLLPL